MVQLHGQFGGRFIMNQDKNHSKDYMSENELTRFLDKLEGKTPKEASLAVISQIMQDLAKLQGH